MCARLPLQISGECRSDLYPKTGFSGSVKLANIILELKRNQKGIEKESEGTEKVTKKETKKELKNGILKNLTNRIVPNNFVGLGY